MTNDEVGSITVNLSDGVAVVEMAHGKANPLDRELLEAFDRELAECATSPAVRSVVVTGAGRVFSGGVDLRRMLDEGPEYAETFIVALGATLARLFAFPKPTVAAINGHAVAGGCLIACACDVRIAAEGSKLGVIELSVGVAFPVAALEVLRHAVGPRMEGLVYGAELVEVETAIAAGIVHEAVEGERLLERAVGEARRLGAFDARAFELTKSLMRAPTIERIERAGPQFDKAVIAQWTDPETRRELASRFGAPKG
jgi:enoyl-CoA hydratase